MAGNTLTDLASVKRYLSISVATSDDILNDMIVGASAALQNFLNRDLFSAPRSDVLDGNGKDRMFLRHWPITAVSALKINGVSVPAANPADFNSAGFRFDENLLMLQGYRFAPGTRNIAIQYTAGYTVIPDEIKLACTLTVALRFREREWTGYTSKSLAGETVSFQLTDIPATVRAALGSYRRVVWP